MAEPAKKRTTKAPTGAATPASTPAKRTSTKKPAPPKAEGRKAQTAVAQKPVQKPVVKKPVVKKSAVKKEPAAKPQKALAKSSPSKGGTARDARAATSKASVVVSDDSALAALEDARERLEHSLTTFQADVDDTTDGAEAETSFNEEDSQGGGSQIALDQLRAMMATARAGIVEIDDAIERVRNGTYGVCVTCHNPIPAARLEALPMATQCVTCKAGSIIRR